MKPILFNTEMVRAILDGRKTVTRRNPFQMEQYSILKGLYLDDKNKMCALFHRPDDYYAVKAIYAPYQPGDILYVRETWRIWKAHRYDADVYIEYKAGKDGVANGTVLQFPFGCTDSPNRDTYDRFIKKWGVGEKWHPSIHMPREAARIFLRVTDVQVERLQDITNEQARKEGCADRDDFSKVWNDCYATPRPVKNGNGIISHYESYPWENIQETRTYRGKPWYVIGNPYLWVIQFERCEKTKEVTP